MSEQKIFITKYALTKGIICAIAQEVSISNNPEHNRATAKIGEFTNYLYGNEFHLDLESAQERTKAMIEKKLQSLEKQKRAIEKMKSDAEQGKFKIKSLVEEGQ